MGIVINEPVNCKIEGVEVVPLKHIIDDRGAVLHMLRCDSAYFKQFGEVYFSIVNPGNVKAWKRHPRMAQNITIPKGKIKFVLYDDRDKSITKGHLETIVIGYPDRYYLLCIPPMIWYGFQSVFETESIIVNCTTIPHDPNEVEHLDKSDQYIPYKWGKT